jgi:Domain of unknown function (DUF4157)/Bacterial SH3 domain/Zeta toxin
MTERAPGLQHKRLRSVLQPVLPLPAPQPADPLAEPRRALQRHGYRPVQRQRLAVQPVLQAAGLQRQEEARVHTGRDLLQRQADTLAADLPAGAHAQALQRQQAAQAPLVSPARPQSPADWVTVMRAHARGLEERNAGPGLNAREVAQHTALQRQVSQALVQGYRGDRGPVAERHASYADHLVSLQRHVLTAPVAKSVLALLPSGERPALQRAVDIALQRQEAQQIQDHAAFQLHTVQRQLAELDHEATRPVFERIQARRGAGNPLPEAIQRHLEQGLNHDLSRVRIHDDAEADQLSKKVNATAFTTGQDIYFRSGQYDPNTRSGLELLAHEVTHATQQAQGKVGSGVDPDAGLESEAQRMGRQLAAPSPAAQPTAPAPFKSARLSSPLVAALALQRKPTQVTPEVPVDKPGFVREEGLNLRTRPDEHSQSLGQFALGTRVMVVSQVGSWARVMTETGQAGYMLKGRLHGLAPEHQALMARDAGLRLFRVRPNETGMQLVRRAYGISGAEGGRDQNLWHFLNAIRKHNTPDAFGSRDLGLLDNIQNALLRGADANNVLLKANTDLWIPSFLTAARDNTVGSGTVSGEASRLLKRLEQKLQDFGTANGFVGAALGPAFKQRLLEGGEELLQGLVVALGGAVVVLGGASAIGALLGGGAPGAAIGFQVGMWLLEWLGLGFLVAWAGSKLGQVFGLLRTYVSTVWNANGNVAQLRLAGAALADALAVLGVTTLQVLVTVGVGKGLQSLLSGRLGKALGLAKVQAYINVRLRYQRMRLGRSARSTPGGAKIQGGLKRTAMPRVVGRAVGAVVNRGRAGNFKGSAAELQALKAGKETATVFTVSGVPAGGKARWAALELPASWTPARQALHRTLLANALKQAKAFAEAAKGEPPTIYAMRGNTAAGKSRAVRGNIPELEGPVGATPNMPHRGVNPDNFKADLYAAQPDVPLTSSQVHSESSTLAAMLQKALLKLKTSDGKAASLLIDKRLASLGEVQGYADAALATGRKLNIYDVDAPLEVSLAGVLERVPGGGDPLPPFQIVADGFTSVRAFRLDVIKYFEAHPQLGKYELFGTTPAGLKVKVAEVVNGKRAINPEYQYMLPDLLADPKSAAELLGSRVITEQGITDLTASLPRERAAAVSTVLREYLGQTWKQALDAHSVSKPK